MGRWRQVTFGGDGDAAAAAEFPSLSVAAAGDAVAAGAEALASWVTEDLAAVTAAAAGSIDVGKGDRKRGRRRRLQVGNWTCS